MVPNAGSFDRRPRAYSRGGRELLLAAVLLLCLDQRPLGAQEADADRDYVLPLVNQALETQRSNVEKPWFNPVTGNGGTIVIRRTFYLDAAKPCREYRRTVERPGAPALVISGTGCRIGPGEWSLEEEGASPIRAEPSWRPAPRETAAKPPDAGSSPGCPPVEPAAGPPVPQPPAFAEFTMPVKAKL